MAEKMGLKIINVEEEQNDDGRISYKMTLQSKMGTYIRGVMQKDWEDEQKKKSIKKHWLKSIGELEAVKKSQQSKTKEERKVEMEAKLKDIVGTELTDE